MKRLILFYATVFLSTHIGYGQRKSSIGIDLAPAICKGTAGVFFAHEISQRWSIGAELYVNIKGISQDMSTEEAEHRNTLEPEGEIYQASDFRDDYVQTSILMQYWPKSHFDGPVFSLGATVKDRSGPDIIAGAGYGFRICKGLRADLMYKIGLIQTFKEYKMPVDGIRIGISYVF